MTDDLKQRMLDADREIAEVIPGSGIYAAVERVEEYRDAIIQGLIDHSQRMRRGRSEVEAA